MPHPDAIRRHARRVHRVDNPRLEALSAEELEEAVRHIRGWQIDAIQAHHERRERTRLGDEQWDIPAGCEAVGRLILALGFAPDTFSPEEAFAGITEDSYRGTEHENRDQGADPRG